LNNVDIYQASIFDQQPSFVEQFDVIYDKDAFGAIEPEQRASYVATVGSYLKPGGFLLLAGCRRERDFDQGPPFDVPPSVVTDAWGAEYKLLETHERLYTPEKQVKPWHDTTYIFQKLKK
jgi:hypothetical protein